MQSGTSGFSFSDGAAFVAGGSGGIGTAITESLAAARTEVVFTYYRNQGAAARLEQSAKRDGRRVEGVQLALENASAVESALQQARDRHGKIHSVIYAAGPGLPIGY